MTLDMIQLEKLATGRGHSFLAKDWEVSLPLMIPLLAQAKVLVIGGAGSIGAAFVKLLSQFSLKSLHIQDISENGLVEIIRTLRGQPYSIGIPDVRTFTFDYGASYLPSFLQNQAYDFIFDFAAVKHVRAEKDPYSLAHLIETNILKMEKLCEAVALNPPQRFFTISTDKAANPTSLMGASKRFMELLLFGLSPTIHVTSSRFANVAFSQGSLLEGWTYRFQKKQPLPVPRETYRYFISHEEASQICLLTACQAPSHHVTIPFFEKQQMVLFEDLAEKCVAFWGYEPVWFDEEEPARARCADLVSQKKWPILKTPLDTAGEKPYEEFIGMNEEALFIPPLEKLYGLSQTPQKMQPFVHQLKNIYAGSFLPPKKEIISLLQKAVPTYTPTAGEKNLDDRL